MQARVIKYKLQDENIVFSLQFAVFSQNTKIQEKKKVEQSAGQKTVYSIVYRVWITVMSNK